MAVPNIFANATASIPLSQLDTNFATTITLGNTAIQLGNTVTTLNNMTLANVTISSGTSNLAATAITNGTSNVTIASSGGNISMATNGATAITVDTSQRVGVGVTPSDWGVKVLQAGAGAVASGAGTASTGFTNNLYTSDAFSTYKYINTGYANMYYQDGNHRWFNVASGSSGATATISEVMRIATSGNLLLGTTTDPAYSGFTTLAVNSATGALIDMQRAGTRIGSLQTNSTDELRLYASSGVFTSYYAGGAERMRIDSSGFLIVGATVANYLGHNSSNSMNSDGSTHALALTIAASGFAEAGGGAFPIGVLRSASSSYVFAGFYSGNDSNSAFSDREFSFRGDGNGYCDGTWNNNGADYAEYFESANGQALSVGSSVVLDGNKVRESTEQDDQSAIIGVVRPKEPSKASMVIGNTAWNKWANKYLTDDFDRYIMEDHDVLEWTDEDGKTHSYESQNIPSGVTVPNDATRKTHDENGVKFQHYKINPEWNPDAEYVNRENRPEWNIIGLVGQVKLLKDQLVNARWIKMRDVSANVEEWFIR